MYPPLLMIHAEMSRRLIASRFRTITAAKGNAKKTGYRGLRYPWESAFTGKLIFYCLVFPVIIDVLLPCCYLAMLWQLKNLLQKRDNES